MSNATPDTSSDGFPDATPDVTTGRRRLTITPMATPQLKRHIRLHTPAGQSETVLLAPEKIMTPNAQAVAVLQLCDGARTVRDICAHLAAIYDADTATIEPDVIAVLQQLADDGYLQS